MKLEDIQKVIGTPEENREILIKALLLDLKMYCSGCDKEFVTAEDMKDLYVFPFVDEPTPAFLECHLECVLCAHMGSYTFRPNPLMPPSVKESDKLYTKLFNAAYYLSDPGPAGQSYEEYLADKESSSGNYALEA